VRRWNVHTGVSDLHVDVARATVAVRPLHSNCTRVRPASQRTGRVGGWGLRGIQALSTDGQRLFLGTTAGELVRADVGAARLVLRREALVPLGRRGNGAAIDAVRVVGSVAAGTERVLTKCINNKMELGPADRSSAPSVTYSMRGAAGNNPCRIDVRCGREHPCLRLPMITHRAGCRAQPGRVAGQCRGRRWDSVRVCGGNRQAARAARAQAVAAARARMRL
jgi:hypothetical protein